MVLKVVDKNEFTGGYSSRPNTYLLAPLVHRIRVSSFFTDKTTLLNHLRIESCVRPIRHHLKAQPWWVLDNTRCLKTVQLPRRLHHLNFKTQLSVSLGDAPGVRVAHFTPLLLFLVADLDETLLVRRVGLGVIFPVGYSG